MSVTYEVKHSPEASGEWTDGVPSSVQVTREAGVMGGDLLVTVDNDGVTIRFTGSPRWSGRAAVLAIPHVLSAVASHRKATAMVPQDRRSTVWDDL